MAYRFYSSPLGWLRLESDQAGLCAIKFAADQHCVEPSGYSFDPILDDAAAWLDAYFAQRTLPPLPALSPAGSAFQQAVRALLLVIPPGETRTYGECARLLGSSPRAVGGALRANPLPILIPCHRVVAAHGLGGYAGASKDGQRRKAWLLAHEQGLKSSVPSPRMACNLK